MVTVTRGHHGRGGSARFFGKCKSDMQEAEELIGYKKKTPRNLLLRAAVNFCPIRFSISFPVRVNAVPQTNTHRKETPGSRTMKRKAATRIANRVKRRRWPPVFGPSSRKMCRICVDCRRYFDSSVSHFRDAKGSSVQRSG